jgi:hypothetical protein
MKTRARAVVLGLAGLTLVACSNVHPGDAAVVDGKSISMTTLDSTAQVYCTLTLSAAQQQGTSNVSNLDIRRQAVVALVSTVVARKLAAEKGVVVKPSEYELTNTQRARVAKAFPKEDIGELEKAIEEAQEVSAIAIALAEKSTGQTRNSGNEAQLAQMGQEEITKAFKDNDVKFAPRFGLNSSSKAVSDTGSLSVAEVDLEKPTGDELPAAQRCS